MGKQPKRIGEILIENGLLTKRQLETGLAIQKKEGGLIGQILLENGFISEKDIIDALTKQKEYLYIEAETPAEILKKRILVVITSLSLTVIFLLLAHNLSFVKKTGYKFYGALLSLEYNLRRPPDAINDILLVTIDNETISSMPYRWPYSRSDFAAVIENLKKAGPKAIAFDFAFYGKSEPAEDEALKNALNFGNKIILPSIINEQGELDFSNRLTANTANTGIVTKIKDSDGVIRRSLTYLVSGDKNNETAGFLSWGMQILKVTKNIDLKSFIGSGHTLIFMNNAGEEWTVPVEEDTKSFLINFRAHTRDFQRISFYRALKGNFDAGMVKDKIVMVGTVSALIQDMENTSIGWLPGLIINANAFLTLYAHDFLKNMPGYIGYIITILGVILAAFSLAWLSPLRAAIIIFSEISVFFLISYILLLRGFIWDYSVFPFAVALFPVLSKKIIYSLKISGILKNKEEIKT